MGTVPETVWASQCVVLFCPASTHSHTALVSSPSQTVLRLSIYQSIKCLKAQRHCPVSVGLYPCFRKPKRKREGPQHFSFPEISRETRGCLVLHSGNSRVSLSLRAGLGQNLRRNRGNRQNTGYFPGIPGVFQVPAKYPVFCRPSRERVG